MTHLAKKTNNRSSRREVFCEKGVLRNFAKFTRKHLCQGPFFNKVAGLRPATLLKKRLCHRCCPVNFAKFLRTPFLTEYLRWLLLEQNEKIFCLLLNITSIAYNKFLKVCGNSMTHFQVKQISFRVRM